MKAILFFTNKCSLNTIDFCDNKIPEIEPKKEYIFQNGNKIILVKDNISLNNFENFWNTIKNGITEFSYVHHRLPSSEIKVFLNDNEDCKCLPPIKGMHNEGSEESKIYLSIKGMVEAEFYADLDNSLFDEIWLKFKKTNQLDEALDLLHKIYNGEDIDEENLSDELKRSVYNYNTTKKDTNANETQLVALRNAILKDKLI